MNSARKPYDAEDLRLRRIIYRGLPHELLAYLDEERAEGATYHDLWVRAHGATGVSRADWDEIIRDAEELSNV